MPCCPVASDVVLYGLPTLRSARSESAVGALSVLCCVMLRCNHLMALRWKVSRSNAESERARE